MEEPSHNVSHIATVLARHLFMFHLHGLWNLDFQILRGMENTHWDYIEKNMKKRHWVHITGEFPQW